MKADDLIRCGDLDDRTSMLSWQEMFVQGSFDALVANALPTAEEDADAARYFLRVFTVTPNIFLLSRQSIELIKEYADRDDRFALFALGRYRLCTMTKPDSLGEACGYIRRAHALGLPEATAEMAQMYDYGDFGLVERAAARALLDEALERNCDYAAEIYLKNLIFGKNGYEADPQKALAIIGERLADDVGRLGAGEENPMWYYLKGCCECNTEGYPAAVGNFRKAAEMGVIMAWADVAVACSHNAEGVLVDKDAFIKAAEYGMSKRDALCRYFCAVFATDGYDDMDRHRQQCAREKFTAGLEEAFSMGCSGAAEMLGDMYYYGYYDIREDNAKAWEWYSDGARLGNAGCYEKLFGMLHDHFIDRDETEKDMIALKGARLGSKRLIGETVMAYTYGRLAEYAAEIERYYEPVFDNPEFACSEDDTFDDEFPDDDGRFDAYA